MTGNRRPGAFPVEPRTPPRTEAPARKPAAIDTATVVPAEIDVFEAEPGDLDPPPPPRPPARRSYWGRILFGALGLLLSLAIGLWIESLLRELYSRAEWLGWTGGVLAAIAVLAALVIIVREAAAFMRLASVVEFQNRAALSRVSARGPADARKLVDDLSRFLSARPETAAGRRALSELRDDVIDAGDLLRLAEVEMLAPLDTEARTLILNAAKRVSLVTAVSPRALVDLAYVLFESGRLVRRIAELYGGRPGTLGFFRLARNVLAHLAVTGSLAATDSLVHQLVGQGLAARLSAKLGEGVVNGMMTVRIGIAAMETARPLPFDAVRRPGLGDFLGQLAAFSRRQAEGGNITQK